MSTEWDEELGRRMQEEHKVLHRLVQVLKEHIATTPGANGGQWLDALRAGYERLHEHIRRTIEIKEKDGYLESVLRVRPSLARQVASIRSENEQILRMAEDLKRDLAATRPEDRLLIADACARILRFIAVIGQHEQRENMIVLFAFNQDLGGD
jgi:hemerythrin-like domain-containing protein